MILNAMDSLVVVEMMMTFEEVFEAEIPDHDVVRLSNPPELVDWLEPLLSNRRPSPRASALLMKLAKKQRRPELAEHLDRTWRREQIAAVISAIFQ